MIRDDLLRRLQDIADLPDLGGTRYRVRDRLGRGGMGTVYLAEDAELGREVALKVLTVADGSGDLSARLLAEARLLARLEHPNIVPVHEVGTLADGRVFYAMKYVRGKRLDEWRRETPPLPVRLRLFQKICEAVAFAHDRGVVHRDLKPENIMVGSFGEALVMDWGVAKLLADRIENYTTLPGRIAPRAGETAHGSVLGTPGYMAPEQARGEILRTDERSDVYALGAILHFLLVGRPPIEGRTREEALERAARGEVAPVRRAAPGVPRDLEAICARALAADPEARYQSARELQDDVDRFLDGFPVAARPVGPLESATRFVRRNRVLFSLILAYLVMRVAIMLFARR